MRLLENLKILRGVLGWSQVEMGKYLGIPQNSYSNYENGKRDLPIEFIEKISQIGISSDWLLTGAINKNFVDYLIGCRMLNKDDGITKSLDLPAAAEKLSVPLAFIESIFDGIVAPSNEFYTKLCDALGIPPNMTFSDDVKKHLAIYEAGRNNDIMIENDVLKNQLHEVNDAFQEYKILKETEIRKLMNRIFELENIDADKKKVG